MNSKNCMIILILLVSAIAFHKRVSAQAGVTLTGSVVDSATAIPAENVSIYLMTDHGVVVQSALTKAAGTFFFKGLHPLKYMIQVIAAGYNSTSIIADLSDSIKRKSDLGRISISKKISGLNEITITARKPLIKQEIDRITYDLQADPESNTTSVLEMMRKVPYLSLDGEDNILMKGNSSYRVFINGKPSAMMERNAKEVLRGMPASTIKSIEVITNPPSKYDAEGLAGIINIIITKKTTNGYNGTLNINERFPTGGPGFGGSVSVKEGRLGISAFGGGSFYNNPETISSVVRNTNRNFETNLLQYGRTKSNSRSGYAGTEISLELDSLNLISGQFNFNGSRSDGISSQQSQLTGNASIIQGYDLANVTDGRGASADGALNYQLGFKSDKNKLLTLSYRYLKFTSEQANGLSIANPVNYAVPGYGQHNNTFSTEQTMQADYVQQVNKLFIEAGVKGIFRNNNSDFQYSSFNAVTGSYHTDTNRLNQFDYTQHIFGAYNAYRYLVSNWEIKAGLRMEETIINADFTATNTSAQQRYFNLLPSISVQRKLDKYSNINLAFGQRIKRPGINRLNPFVDRSNPNFESSGNPELRPVVSNRLSVAYGISRKLSFNTGLDFTVVKKIDLRISYFDPVTNITHVFYQNTGNARAFDYSANVSYPITKSWNVSVNGTISFVHLEGLVNKLLIENDYVIYNVSAASGYRFNKGWRVNANLSIMGPNPTSLQGSSNKMITSSFSVNKDLVKEKLSFSLALTNPFTTYRHNITRTYGPDFKEVIDNRNYFRLYSCSLNYNFGKLKQAIKKNKRGIKNDDL